MLEYKIMYFDETERDQRECSNCKSKVPLFKFTNTLSMYGSRDFYWCELCSSTMFSIADKYPNQCSDATLYQAIAGGLQWLKKEIIKELKSPTPEGEKGEQKLSRGGDL